MPYSDRVKMYEAQKRHRIKVRAALLDFLSRKMCIDCGETDAIVLDFDHKDPEKKFKPISKLLSGHYSWTSVLKEIDKCEIRCANCHRRKTYKSQGGWGKTKSVI